MSIIQQIREKAAWLVFGLIALSLLGFLLMDAFVGKSGRGLFGGNSTSLGTVNGHSLEPADYESRIKQMEDQYKSYGYPTNDMTLQSIREQAFNQFIAETTVDEEVDKLGLSVTAKELDDILFSPNAPDDFKRQFTNEQGVYDINAAKNAIAQLRKQKGTMADNFNNIYLPALIKNRLREKYISLLANTAYYPKWMLEKLNSDNSSMAAVSYVHVPYISIPDSTMKVSDDEIADYVSKHKDEYKQEESRSIAYVAIDASPSKEDTAELYNKLVSLKQEFSTTAEKDIPAFISRNGSQINFSDVYVLKSKMQMPDADSIRNTTEGGVFGPYQDAGTLTLARMIAKRNLPDSVKCRHILISTQSGLEDSVAKRRIDSIVTAIKGGADFAALAKKYSDDPGSKDKGGEYEFSSTNTNLAKEFYDVIFNGAVNDKKTVKTTFGYHYIEVLNQKNFEPAYKVAYLSKPLIPSTKTTDSASGLASQFASESRSASAFDENVKKHNYNKLLAPDIKPNDMVIASIGSSRQMVKWIYDADKGDVSEMFVVDNKDVVAVVTDITKEGTLSPAKARPVVEYIIRNQKKGEQIKKNIGTANTLEAVAGITKTQVLKADSVSFLTPFFPNAGQEGKVGGYAFNPAAKGRVSTPLAGNTGVYVIRTENVYAKPNFATGIEQQRQMMMQNQKMTIQRQGVIETALKKAAKVKDNRRKMY
jgi:peptidyl-prolyl cis-trans isomerase D